MTKRTRDGRTKSGSMHTTGAIVIKDNGDDFWNNGGQGPAQRSFTSEKCHESHPALSIYSGTLLGGNCRDHERHTSVDLYVALDAGMRHPYFEEGQSWLDAPVSIYYPIQNMDIPKNADKFRALVKLIADALEGGATVHVGCIGGHGRTGMVLAAVVAYTGVSKDAITYVRQNYCKKAVESRAQEGFLAAHFGCPLPAHNSRVDKRKAGF